MGLHTFQRGGGASKPKRRVGRGIGSGMGPTATRGTNAQKARRPIHPNFAGDKSLSLGLTESFRAAWGDPDLRARLLFVLGMFAVFVFGVPVPVPVPGFSSNAVQDLIKNNSALDLVNIYAGGALRRITIFALT